MPNATVSIEPVRKELKTLDGAYVLIKQHGFGHTLSRRDKAARYLQEVDPNRKPTDVSQVEIALMNEASTKYDFVHCIVDHNLDDANGVKLDFNNPVSFDVLDPRVGSEISHYIDELNGADFDPTTFTTPSGASTTRTGAESRRDEE